MGSHIRALSGFQETVGKKYILIVRYMLSPGKHGGYWLYYVWKQ